MTVNVQIIPTSDFIHDREYDWYEEDQNGRDRLHLGFVCPHDCIKVEDGEVWCPDCEDSGQGLTPEDVERAFASLEPGEMDDES